MENNNHYCVGCNTEIEKCTCPWKSFRELFLMFSELSRRLDSMEIQVNIMKALGYKQLHPKRPHKCPVCDGFGSPLIKSDECVSGPRKHYVAINPCHACEGKGVLWR